jgi:hypothetical protein
MAATQALTCNACASVFDSLKSFRTHETLHSRAARAIDDARQNTRIIAAEWEARERVRAAIKIALCENAVRGPNRVRTNCSATVDMSETEFLLIFGGLALILRAPYHGNNKTYTADVRGSDIKPVLTPILGSGWNTARSANNGDFYYVLTEDIQRRLIYTFSIKFVIQHKRFFETDGTSPLLVERCYLTRSCLCVSFKKDLSSD